MSEAQAPKKSGGWLKAGIVGLLGLGGGAIGTYATAVVDKIARPPRPVANFAIAADGLSITCQNHASGESGWWDFGDGSPLEPFAPDQPITHNYAKPGTYTVKLTVRNFLADENERSVAVQVPTAGKDTTTTAPQVSEFVLQPVSSVAVAPATFRVTARLANVESCVWDLGDGRLEVTAGGDHIDRLVTYEQPGAFVVQVIAHNNKQAVRAAAPVRVEAPTEGTLMAVLRVKDTGARVERIPVSKSVAVAVPNSKGSARGFTKSISARPGFAIAEAELPNTNLAGVKGLKVQVEADRRSATISGEWAGDPKAVTKAVGGSDVIIPVALTEERSAPVAPSATVIAGTFVGLSSFGAATLPLPPQPIGLANSTREMTLEIRKLGPGGQPTVLKTVKLAPQPPGQPLWKEVVPLNGVGRTFGAVQEGSTLKVTYGGQ